MPVDENLIAAILHAEFQRWSHVYEPFLTEEGKERASKMTWPWDDLPDAEKEEFLNPARRIVALFKREEQPEV